MIALLAGRTKSVILERYKRENLYSPVDMSIVPAVSETELWVAELDYLEACDPVSRCAQFAIRTAVRAQCLAKAAGTDPVDELLDARGRVLTDAARAMIERAVRYVRADQCLDRDLDVTW